MSEVELDEHGRPEPPAAADERATLNGFLDFQRATIVWKVSGLTDEQAWRAHPTTAMTAAGVVTHLTHVERFWFGRELAGLELLFPWDVQPAGAQDDDADWHEAAAQPLETTIAAYRAACAQSRSLSARFDLDDVTEGSRGQSHRWILVHMVEETARHAGHLDLLREAIDGATGE